MHSLPRPLAFLLLLVSGWVNRQQQAVIDYRLEFSHTTGSVVPNGSVRSLIWLLTSANRNSATTLGRSLPRCASRSADCSAVGLVWNTDRP